MFFAGARSKEQGARSKEQGANLFLEQIRNIFYFQLDIQKLEVTSFSFLFAPVSWILSPIME
jgi:hypothetical protein